MSNNLRNETSPYLLQHSDNPVEWYPWCDEAFERAKTENKPIFLSIGYSTCHWCHVMAHESFEDKETAKILNTHFICIKVDREERPDIDSVYMTVCQSFTGSGGWPMSIFMSWDKKPFFAGTYFPIHSRYGMPGFSDILINIVNEWKTNREKLLRSAQTVIEALTSDRSVVHTNNSTDLATLAAEIFEKSFDRTNGGFGPAPKFPSPHNLLFLILYSKYRNSPEALKMAEKTLVQMRKGGIFDQIGYGFSRYSTDKYFLVPHFEKMLYDNALLMIAYTVIYTVTDNSLYIDTAEKTAEYILNEMTDKSGGFYSAQDADSEGIEGKYYTFTLKEIQDVLEEEGKRFASTFDISEKGNFEGVNIPNLLKSNNTNNTFDKEIHKLYDYRKKRVSLHLDDKILLSQNAMMITALALLYRVTRNDKYLSLAKTAQIFIENNLCEGVKLYTSYRNKKHSNKSFCDDYAYYIVALTELYNSTLDSVFIERAQELCNVAIKRFYDKEKDGFFMCDSDSNELFMNPKETYDGAIPSSNSVMFYNFVRLFSITRKSEYEKLTQKQLRYMSEQAKEYPAGHTMFLFAKLLYEYTPLHITVSYKDTNELENIKNKLPFFADITLRKDDPDFPCINNKTTYYICKSHNCLPPTNSLDIF